MRALSVLLAAVDAGSGCVGTGTTRNGWPPGESGRTHCRYSPCATTGARLPFPSIDRESRPNVVAPRSGPNMVGRLAVKDQ
jgi:hypothetical protein